MRDRISGEQFVGQAAQGGRAVGQYPPPTSADSGRVSSMVNAIAETVSDLQVRLDALEKRLSDVSIGGPVNTPECRPEQPPPPMSDLARSLRTINGNLSFLADRISAIQSRIDL